MTSPADATNVRDTRDSRETRPRELQALRAAMSDAVATNDYSVEIAVEDKFVLFRMHKPNGLLPAEHLVSQLIDTFVPLGSIYRPILDAGDLDALTSDAIEFIECCAGYWGDKVQIIVDRRQAELLAEWPRRLPKPLQIDRRDWEFDELSLVHFLDGDDLHIYRLYSELHRTIHTAGLSAPTRAEWVFARDCSSGVEDFWGDDYEEFRLHWPRAVTDSLMPGYELVVGARYLKERLRAIGRNSLMTQLAVALESHDTVSTIPYHAHALYEANPISHGNRLILTRPAVLARRTEAIFSEELTTLSKLLSDDSATESDFQRFFEKNDVFLRMLGYKQIYPKVVLERDDGTRLQPDFMLEPMDAEFWDILDLKKPEAPLIVGARDRKDFSSAVHQLRAQLREYSAYFDEEKHRKRVADRYGIQAYKPRLIGIIGRHYNEEDELQLQRVRTRYNDCRLLTFAELEGIAKRRLLI